MLGEAVIAFLESSDLFAELIYDIAIRIRLVRVQFELCLEILNVGLLSVPTPPLHVSDAHLARRISLGELGDSATKLRHVCVILRLSRCSVEQLLSLLLVQIADVCLRSVRTFCVDSSTYKLRPELVELLIERSDDLLVLQNDRLDSLVELGQGVSITWFGVSELGRESHVFAAFAQVTVVQLSVSFGQNWSRKLTSVCSR